jgi:NAD(P)H dehydrogenase (quinone)
MILVTGAAGKTGTAVLHALIARGTRVRALARSERHAAALQALGVQDVHIGALEDGAALTRALAGVAAVYHICPNVSPHEQDFARAIAAAAGKAGVRRIVYHSVLHPQIEAMPHHWAKMRAEELLLEADLELTILQPTAYMQNILSGWPEIAGGGIYRVPYPAETRLSLVDLGDVAAAAARVLTEPGHVGATYELVGTLPVSQIQVAEALSHALGHPVRIEAEPVERWAERTGAGGLGTYQRDTLIAMFRHYAHHGLVGNPGVLTWLLGRPPTTLAQFAAHTVKFPPA